MGGAGERGERDRQLSVSVSIITGLFHDDALIVLAYEYNASLNQLNIHPGGECLSA